METSWVRSQSSPPGGAVAPRRILDLPPDWRVPVRPPRAAGGHRLYFIFSLFLFPSSGRFIPPPQKDEGHCAFEVSLATGHISVSVFRGVLRLGFIPSWTVQVSGRGVRG